MFWKNWKTISEKNYYTESDNPILKKDSHHAEIIDITDGLVVEYNDLSFNDFELDNYEPLKRNEVWDAFGRKKL